MKKTAVLTLLTLAVVLFLPACGGGGGGGTSGSQNWDQMVWDQDNWA